MGDGSSFEQYEYFGTAPRVLQWTAMGTREEPAASGGASEELAAEPTWDVVLLTRGEAGEGSGSRVRGVARSALALSGCRGRWVGWGASHWPALAQAV